MNFDVFNGDADGLCALLQLRLAQPAESILITGVKRDIGLLERTPAQAGDLVTVLDVSFDKNRAALSNLLEQGVSILYMDHHYPGEILSHPELTVLIDTDAEICTSLIMDRYLGGLFTEWAVVGAFGDNLDAAAQRAAKTTNLTAQELLELKQLGICINYNAYGREMGDLYFAPDDLYRHLAEFYSPLAFIQKKAEVYRRLQDGYLSDMSLAGQIKAELQTDKVAVFILPDEKWARRVSGVWGNELANRFPNRAHAIITGDSVAGYQVSVRSPLRNKYGADLLCNRFSGGGRKAAAGINHLSNDRLADFCSAFQRQYQ